MSSSAELVQGDDRPTLTATLKDSTSGDPIDLSDVSSVRFRMRKSEDRRWTVNSTATIVNAGQGTVSYSWAADDLSNPGTYEARWHLIYNDATEQSTDPANTITVKRR